MLASYERTRSPDDPQVVTVRANLAGLHLELNDAERAHALTEELWRTHGEHLEPHDSTRQALLFNLAARRVRLSTLGLVQYLAPSMHFVLAVAFFGETFSSVHAVVFGLIWTGLALFSWDTQRQRRAQRRATAGRV